MIRREPEEQATESRITQLTESSFRHHFLHSKVSNRNKGGEITQRISEKPARRSTEIKEIRAAQGGKYLLDCTAKK